MTTRQARPASESPLHYQLLAEHSTDVILRATPDGRIRYVSPACFTVMGYAPDELIGTRIIDYAHPDDLHGLTAGLAAIDDWTDTVSMTGRFQHRDGHYIWIEATATLVRDREHRIVEIQTSSRDITPRMEAEQALRDSEARFRLLADNSTDLTARLDSDATFLYVSPSSRNLIGYEPGELIGTPSMRFVHPDDQERTRALLTAAVRSSKPVTVVNRALHRNGTCRWFETTCTMGRDPVTGDIEIHAIARDVTERKRTDDALRESEEWFRNVFEGSPIGIAMTDDEFRFVRVNDAYCELLGYAREELLGVHFLDVTYAPDAEQGARAARGIISGGLSRYHCEKRYVRKNGDVIWVSLHAAALPGQPDGQHRNLVMVENISERKRIEDELRNIASMKSDFVAFVSHELRAPLTTIGVGLSLLRDNGVAGNASALHTIELLSNETQRLTTLVESILDVNRAEALDAAPAPQPVALDALLRRVVAQAQVGGGQSVTLDLPPVLPPAWCDETQTEEVVRNLIGNATKYGGDAGIVIAARAVDDGTLEFSVADAGPGIPEGERERVFDRNYRGETGTSTADGHGLGLYFARRLIDAQGGHIVVTSGTMDPEAGHGATFTVTLPRAAERC